MNRSARGRFVVIGISLAAVLVPLLWTFAAAIDVLPDNQTSPPSWTFSPSHDQLANVSVVEPSFWQELITSIGVSAVATALTVTVSMLASYGLARSGHRVGRRLAPLLLVLASLPAVAYVVPLSDVARRIGLLDTLAGITLAEAAATAPLAVYVFVGYLGATSPDGEEAARLDGAGLGALLRHVVLPHALPMVVATSIVLFVLDWNQLLVPLVVTGINVRTLPVILTDFFTLEREVEWPTAAAALTISLVPVLVIVAVFHRFLERFSLPLNVDAEA